MAGSFRRIAPTPRLPAAASRFAVLPLLSSAPRNAAMSLLCYNRGCGQRFDPETNTEGEDGAGGPSRLSVYLSFRRGGSSAGT